MARNKRQAFKNGVFLFEVPQSLSESLRDHVNRSFHRNANQCSK